MGDALADWFGSWRRPERRLAVGAGEGVGRPRCRHLWQIDVGFDDAQQLEIRRHCVERDDEVDRQAEPAEQEAVAADRGLDAMEVEVAAQLLGVRQWRRRGLGAVVEDDEAGQLVGDGAAGPEHGDVVTVDVDDRARLGVQAPRRLPGRRPQDLLDAVVELTGERP